MTISTKTPAGFRIVAGLSLLWNGFGAVDYTLTKMRNPGYLANFPPEMMAAIDNFPAWMTAFWALGVWGSLAGSVLLLMRSRHAVTAFWVSLLGLAVSTAYQILGDSVPDSMMTAGFFAMNALIWASLLFFIWYARRALKQGLLR